MISCTIILGRVGCGEVAKTLIFTWNNSSSPFFSRSLTCVLLRRCDDFGASLSSDWVKVMLAHNFDRVESDLPFLMRSICLRIFCCRHSSSGEMRHCITSFSSYSILLHEAKILSIGSTSKLS